jgi:hypothetical protein
MVRYQSNYNYILHINGYLSIQMSNTNNRIRTVQYDDWIEQVIKNEIKNNFFVIKDGELVFALYDIKPNYRFIKKKLTPSVKRLPNIQRYE